MVLHISDLDEVTDKQNIKIAVQSDISIRDEEIKITSLRPTFAGSQKTTVKVSVDMGIELARKGRLLVGMLSCHVRQKEQSQRCYRC